MPLLLLFIALLDSSMQPCLQVLLVVHTFFLGGMEQGNAAREASVQPQKSLHQARLNNAWQNACRMAFLSLNSSLISPSTILSQLQDSFRKLCAALSTALDSFLCNISPAAEVEVNVPVRYTTCATFGGADLQTMYRGLKL